MRKVLIGCLALAAYCAEAAQTPWQKIDHPIAGAPSAIGSFANGCIIGAQPLPLEAGNYQVLRPDSAALLWPPRFAVVYPAPEQSGKTSGAG